MRRAAWPLVLLLIVVPVIATGLKAVHGDGPSPTGLEQDVTQAMNDLRRLQTAIKAYQLDNGSLPQPNPPIPGRLHWWGFVPSSLTTPDAYIESLPANPFADGEVQTLWGMVSDEPENLTYLYINDLLFARWSIGSIVTRHPDYEGFTIPPNLAST